MTAPFKQVWRVYADWDLGLNDWVFVSRESALRNLRHNPIVQDLLAEYGETLDDWQSMGYLKIAPLSVSE